MVVKHRKIPMREQRTNRIIDSKRLINRFPKMPFDEKSLFEYVKKLKKRKENVRTGLKRKEEYKNRDIEKELKEVERRLRLSKNKSEPSTSQVFGD